MEILAENLRIEDSMLLKMSFSAFCRQGLVTLYLTGAKEIQKWLETVRAELDVGLSTTNRVKERGD